MFAGRLLRFLRLHENVVECAEGGTGEPMVPAYEGGRLPLTTNLADRVRGLLQNPSSWDAVPRAACRNGCSCRRRAHALPGRNDLLVETFPRGDRWYLVAYCFEGRNAHQTLGMLLTRRMERAGYAPLGFVATDYVLGIWSAEQPRDVARLFDQDMLGDDLETWLAESSMLRRTFRNVAVIAGLIERHHPGAEKTRKQVTVNSRPDLRRAAPAPAGPHPAARHAGRCGGRADRSVAHRGDAGAGEGTRSCTWCCRACRRWRCRCCWRSAARACATESDEEKLLAEAEAIIAEATGEQEPPPVKAIHRGNAMRRRDAQTDLFWRRASSVSRRRGPSGPLRLSSHPVEQIQHPLAPCGDRIIRAQQLEPADAARPLQTCRTRCSRHSSARRRPARRCLPSTSRTGSSDARNSATRVSRPSCTASSVMPNRASRLSRKYARSCGATTSSRSRTISRAMPPSITPSAQALMNRACARPVAPPNRLGRSG